MARVDSRRDGGRSTPSLLQVGGPMLAVDAVLGVGHDGGACAAAGRARWRSARVRDRARVPLRRAGRRGRGAASEPLFEPLPVVAGSPTTVPPLGVSRKHARGATSGAPAGSGATAAAMVRLASSSGGGAAPATAERATTPAFVSTSASDLAALAVQTENYTWQFIGRAEPGLERPALRRDIRTLERQYLDAAEHVTKLTSSGTQGACPVRAPRVAQQLGPAAAGLTRAAARRAPCSPQRLVAARTPSSTRTA